MGDGSSWPRGSSLSGTRHATSTRRAASIVASCTSMGRRPPTAGARPFAGTIVPSTPLRLDLAGDAAHLDLRNLPRALKVPSVPSDLSVAYRLAGTTTNLAADATFRPSTLAGASIADGGTAGVTLSGGRSRIGPTRQCAISTSSASGSAFGIAALTADRYRSVVNGSFVVNGSGTRLEQMTLDARGTLVESSLFGGQVPQLDVRHAPGRAGARDQGQRRFQRRSTRRCSPDVPTSPATSRAP